MPSIEILHNLHGDKRKKIDTSEAAGREAFSLFVTKMFGEGNALFLERGKNVYRIKGYDAKRDKLIVELDVKGKSKKIPTRAAEAKVTAVAPVAGGM
jgi:hypothetical protein